MLYVPNRRPNSLFSWSYLLRVPFFEQKTTFLCRAPQISGWVDFNWCNDLNVLSLAPISAPGYWAQDFLLEGPKLSTWTSQKKPPSWGDHQNRALFNFSFFSWWNWVWLSYRTLEIKFYANMLLFGLKMSKTLRKSINQIWVIPVKLKHFQL